MIIPGNDNSKLTRRRQKLIETQREHVTRDLIFLTYNYQSLGGVQRSTTTIANGLYAQGHSVRILSVSPGAIPMSHNLEPAISVTMCNPRIQTQQRVIRSSLGRKISKPMSKILSYWKPKRLQFAAPIKEGVRKLSHELDAHDETAIIIVTDIAAMNYLNHALKERSAPRPKIIGQHKGNFSALSRSNVSRLAHTFADADLLLGLTELDADQMSRVVNIPVSSIANPIPAAPREYHNLVRQKRFVALGRLAPEKSYASAIRAWKPIAETYPEWQLHIYGEGPLRRELEQLINKEGLSHHVLLAGRTDDPLMVLSQARGNLVTSKHEGFGLTISEAATVATPTIAFDTSPGIRLQLEHERNGLLVPQGDGAELTKAIMRLITEESLYQKLSAGALKSVRQFDIDKIIRAWEQYLNAVSR